MRTPIRRSRLVATLCSVVCTAVFTGATPSLASPIALPDVIVIGDSLTVGAHRRGGLETRLARVSTPHVTGVNGLAAHQTPDVLRTTLARSPRTSLVVVAVGTNDATHQLSSAAFERRVIDVLHAAGNRRVLWVNLYVEASPSDARRLNKVLDRIDRRNHRLVVLNWASHAGARMLVNDGIHLTTAGYRHRASFIHAAVRDALTPQPTAP